MHKASIPKKQQEKAIVIIDSDDEDDIIPPPRPSNNSKNSASTSANNIVNLTEDDDEPWPTVRITPLPASRVNKSPVNNSPDVSRTPTASPVRSLSTPLPKLPSSPQAKSLSPRPTASPATTKSPKIPTPTTMNSPKRPNSATMPKIPSSPQRTPSTSLTQKPSSPMISPHRSNSQSKASSSSYPIIDSNRPIIPPISKTLHSPDKRLSLPRSALISKTSSRAKKPSPSSIVKAASSPVRKPLTNTALKRPIDSPERPPSRPILNRSPSSSQQQVYGSPERPPSQSIFSSPVRAPPAMDLNKRAKESFSPFSNRPVKKKVYSIEDEDGKDEDLDTFVAAVQGTIRTVKVDNTPKVANVQCPLCYYLFPRDQLLGHASEYTGEANNVGNVIEDPKIGAKRVVRKRTIADAIKLDESERKRLNKGKIDGGPTNYYADSESILALDGVGFNSEVHGMSWESSGQTRFG